MEADLSLCGFGYGRGSVIGRFLCIFCCKNPSVLFDKILCIWYTCTDKNVTGGERNDERSWKAQDRRLLC